jgi:lysophospholipase L1-like esterase
MPFHKDNSSGLRTAIASLAILAAPLLIFPAIARQPTDKSPKETAKPPELIWHAISPDEVIGKGWKDTKTPFDRLPAQAEKIVRKSLWELSRHSAGLYADFNTDAKSISARWTLTSDRLAMAHMAATGVSGLDLYINRHNKWHFLASGRPSKFPTNEVELVTGLASGSAHYRLYFPLYNGVSAVEIGVPAGSSFDLKREPDRHKPVVIYGTSITQGGCASRPGMSFPAILGRRLDVPVINLGFSGNGKAEVEMARLLAELDAAAFILDPLPNLFPNQVDERLPEFIHVLRASHPDVPILLNENPVYPTVKFVRDQERRVEESNEILRRIGKAKTKTGDGKIFVVPACDLSAEAGEATVDGIHPTDVGFVMMADAIEPVLRKAIVRPDDRAQRTPPLGSNEQ